MCVHTCIYTHTWAMYCRRQEWVIVPDYSISIKRPALGLWGQAKMPALAGNTLTRDSSIFSHLLPFRTSSLCHYSHARQQQSGRKWITEISQDFLFSYLIIQTRRLEVTLSKQRDLPKPDFSRALNKPKAKGKRTYPNPTSTGALGSESTCRPRQEDVSSCLPQNWQLTFLEDRLTGERQDTCIWS